MAKVLCEPAPTSEVQLSLDRSLVSEFVTRMTRL
jgi:hypothetical protein